MYYPFAKKPDDGYRRAKPGTLETQSSGAVGIDPGLRLTPSAEGCSFSIRIAGVLGYP